MKSSLITLLACAVLVLASCRADVPLEEQSVTDYGRSTIPERPAVQPNMATLRHYLDRCLSDHEKFHRYQTDGSASPSTLVFSVREDEAVTAALRRSALFSYLRYENGAVAVDAISPPDRFGDMVTNQTPLFSMSIGKSVVGYLLGHAICEGHIPSLDHTLSDWPLMANTLYEDASLADLAAMRAGDQEHLHKFKGFLNSGRWPNNFPLSEAVEDELAGTKPAPSTFNYNPLPPNIVLGYIAFKLGGKRPLERFMGTVFQEHVGTEHPVFFLRQRAFEETGPARASMYATRYDYLRIAAAMLDDWRSDTCVGRYLKALFASRKAKNDPDLSDLSPFGAAKEYTGFFHTGFYSSDRPILAMDGYGGQTISINFETGIIVATHAVHRNYDWRRLVYRHIE